MNIGTLSITDLYTLEKILVEKWQDAKNNTASQRGRDLDLCNHYVEIEHDYKRKLDAVRNEIEDTINTMEI